MNNSSETDIVQTKGNDHMQANSNSPAPASPPLPKPCPSDGFVPCKTENDHSETKKGMFWLWAALISGCINAFPVTLLSYAINDENVIDYLLSYRFTYDSIFIVLYIIGALLMTLSVRTWVRLSINRYGYYSLWFVYSLFRIVAGFFYVLGEYFKAKALYPNAFANNTYITVLVIIVVAYAYCFWFVIHSRNLFRRKDETINNDTKATDLLTGEDNKMQTSDSPVAQSTASIPKLCPFGGFTPCKKVDCMFYAIEKNTKPNTNPCYCLIRKGLITMNVSGNAMISFVREKKPHDL